MKRSFLSYIKTPFFRVMSFLMGAVFAAGLVTTLSVKAVDTLALGGLDLFELEADANAVEDLTVGADDWATLFADCGDNNEPDAGATGCGNSDAFTGILTDPAGQTTFTTGSKDILEINTGWEWENKSVPDKDEITHAYAAAYQNTADIGPHMNGDLILYAGLDRYANNGDAQAGFWFFRNPVGLASPPMPGGIKGQFFGTHALGDILLTLEYSPSDNHVLIDVYRWNPAFANNLELLAGGVSARCDAHAGAPYTMVCGTANTSTAEAPWDYEAKFEDPSFPTDFPHSSFFEVGINFNAILRSLELPEQSVCFSSFLGETRSSHSETADLKDFVLDNFDVCSVEVDKEGDTLSKVGDDADYFITITNTGAVTLYKESIVDNVLGDLTNGSNPVIVDSDCGDSLAAGDSCTIHAVREVQAGDPDSLDNTVSIVYDSRSDLLGDERSASDDHSVNLFQPSIALDKTGDELSKIGDEVDYTITLDNTSSADTPDLDCTITDGILGVLEDVTLSSGTSHAVSASGTIPGDATDPYPNTATASCSPEGFENVLPADASHDVNLFQPNVEVIKTGETLSKVGDTVTYDFTINNLSSDDTPDLTLDSISDTLLGDLSADAGANGCSPLGYGGSCSFSVDRVVQDGDNDPLPNTVTVHYDVVGFSNDVTDDDDHEVNLFQPSLTATLACDQQGYDLNSVLSWTLTLDNTSSSDSPNLVPVGDLAIEIVRVTEEGNLPHGGDSSASLPTLAWDAADAYVSFNSANAGISGTYRATVSGTYNADGFVNNIPVSGTADCEVLAAPANIRLEKLMLESEAYDFTFDALLNGSPLVIPLQPRFSEDASSSLRDFVPQTNGFDFFETQETIDDIDGELVVVFTERDVGGTELEPGTGLVCDGGDPVYDFDNKTISVTVGPFESVTCLFVNRELGRIIVHKDTDPDGSAQSFDFSASYDADGFSLMDGEMNDSGLLSTGIYSVSETVPEGWDLTSATCDDQSPPSAIDLQPGEVVHCYFVNTQRGRIIVDKVTDPSGSAQLFDFSLTGGPSALNQIFQLADQTTPHDSGYVLPGSGYVAAETTVPSGWELTSATCDDSSPVGNIDVAPGETVTCTFVNTEQLDFQSCTPGYWKQDQHFGSWPAPYAPLPGDLYETVFGVSLPNKYSDYTLLDALNAGGNSMNEALLRHSVAALLNAASADDVLHYPYDPDEVIAIVQAAFGSGGDKEAAHQLFAEANEIYDCSLGRDPGDI